MIGNRFLDYLAPAVSQDCLQAAVTRTFAPGDVVAHRGDRVAEALFPLRGAVSEIEEGLDGGSTEVTALGPEGVSGFEALLDAPLCPFLRVTEVHATVVAVPIAQLLEVRERSPALHRLLHRYAIARLQGAGISIGCNARHDAQSRLARWLLRMNDRVGDADFELTHATISSMLGVRRETVTRAIAGLAAENAISAGRNAVSIIDRARLEGLCCSCYAEARALYDTLYAVVGE